MNQENIKARSLVLIEKEKRALGVAGKAEIRGKLEARSDLVVEGKTSLIGDVTVHRKLVVEGDIECASLEAKLASLVQKAPSPVVQEAPPVVHEAPHVKDPRLTTRPAFSCTLTPAGDFTIETRTSDPTPLATTDGAMVHIKAGGDVWSQWLYEPETNSIRSLPEYLAALDRHLATTSFSTDLFAALRRSFPATLNADIDALKQSVRYPGPLFDHLFAKSYASFKAMLERVRSYYNVAPGVFYKYWVAGDAFDIHVRFACQHHHIPLTIRLTVV